MNYQLDLSKESQKLLKIAGVKVENKEHSTEEIKSDINEIGNYIISQSSKNGDIEKAQAEYMPLINTLQKNII